MQRLKHSPFHSADKITVGCPSGTYQAFSYKNIVHTCWAPWSELRKMWGAVGTSTRADACALQANHSFNHSSSHRRRFQTGQTPEKLARMFRLLISRDTLEQMAHMWDSLVPVSSWVKIVRKLHPCWPPLSVPRDTPEKPAFMLHSLVRVVQQKRWKKKKKTFLCVSLTWSLGLVVGTWKHKRGQDTRDNRHMRQQRETLR